MQTVLNTNQMGMNGEIEWCWMKHHRPPALSPEVSTTTAQESQSKRVHMHLLGQMNQIHTKRYV